MKGLKTIHTCFLLFLIFFVFDCGVLCQSFLKVQRLSERIIVLTESSEMDINIVAISTHKGLVVIDATNSPYTAMKMREKIEQEFSRKDFAYVINTHHHWDHTWGNQAFADVDIIAHENCPELLLADASGSEIASRLTRARRILAEKEKELSNLNIDSSNVKEIQQDIAYYKNLIKGLSKGFKATLPNIVFSDRMTVNLGDVTLKMLYFGRAHSVSDIFIWVPEEGILMTGDIFRDQRWLPGFSNMRILDIPRWIEVLGEILDGDNKLRKVIPAHKDLWTPEKLTLWRDYIVDLWNFVNHAKKNGT